MGASRDCLICQAVVFITLAPFFLLATAPQHVYKAARLTWLAAIRSTVRALTPARKASPDGLCLALQRRHAAPAHSTRQSPAGACRL